MISKKYIGIILGIMSVIGYYACNHASVPKIPNILLICVDDLRPELNSFGADHIISPNIDALAEEGMAFHRHYVNAPSCGPSRYTLLTGQYGTPSNYALFKRASMMEKDTTDLFPSMPEYFRNHGYTTVSVGKVSHHPGGMGGHDWNDTTILEMPNAWDRFIIPTGSWKHPRGIMHGLAHGEIRNNPKNMDVYQSATGEDTIYPDGIITKAALEQVNILAKEEQPFFLAVGLIKPHLPFGAPKKYYDAYQDKVFPKISNPDRPKGVSTWHNSGEFRNYNLWEKDPVIDQDFAYELRRHYAACVSYADMQVGKIIDALNRSAAADNTIIVLWGDHGWHLGEHAIWGKHSLYEESLHSPLIIHYPERHTQGKISNAIVETLDIFPTLCTLTDLEVPKFVQGKSLVNILDNPSEKGHVAMSYWRKARTIRTNNHRLILHGNGEVELYDHTTMEGETKNVAKMYPDLVEQLKVELWKKAGKKSSE